MHATPTMRGRTVVVTGATTGIGRATAEGLGRLGARLLITGRDRARGADAVQHLSRATGADVEFLAADLASLASVRQLAQEIARRTPQIDVLVNNAGVAVGHRRPSADGHELMFQVNHLAPFLLTTSLLPLLHAGAPARVVDVATVPQAGLALDLDDLQSERPPFRALTAYGRSKLALTLFTYELARRVPADRVGVHALEPGWVRTPMTRGADGPFRWINLLGRPLQVGAARGARAPIHVASAPELRGTTGTFHSHRGRPRRSAPASYDTDTARRLWDLSEDLVRPFTSAAGR